MTREEIIRNLKYTMEKHKNDTVKTFDTNISAMCKDILDYLEQEPCDVFDEYGNYNYPSDVELTEPNTATSMPCEDAISREDALMCLTGEWTEITDEIIHRFIKRIKALPPVNPQPKAEQFAKWVAGEIFDDMWEYNKDAFAEIACRKLAKLGIVIRTGDEWELIELQESENK